MKNHSLLHQLAPRAAARWESVPVIGPSLQTFTSWLSQKGYTGKTIRHRLGFLPKLGCRLQRQNVDLVEGLTREHMDAAEEACRLRLPQMLQAVRSFRLFLQEQELLREGELDPPSPSEQELTAFGAHLREVRGLAANSIRGHQRRLRPFFELFTVRPPEAEFGAAHPGADRGVPPPSGSSQ